MLCALSVVVHQAQGQNQGFIDSLQTILQTQQGGERFPVLYELVFQYIEKDNNRALELIEQAESAAFLSGDSLSIVKGRRVRGQILMLLERTSEAVESFRKALPIAVRHHFTKEEYFIESDLARIEIFTGAYDKALKRYDKILSMAKGWNSPPEVASTLNKIGLTYYKLKDYNKAVLFYKRALEEGRSLDAMPFSLISANLALCYAHLGDFKTATMYTEASLSRCAPRCDDVLRSIEYALAVISLGQQQDQDAERHLLRSLKLARNVNDSRFQLDNIYLLADLYLERQSFEKAENILLDAECLIDRGTPFNLEKIKIYSRFSQLYLAIRDYRKASFYQSKYILLKDSVYNEELTTSLMKAEASFAERENKAKLAAQEQIIRLHEEVIEGQHSLNILGGTVAILLIAVVIFLYKSYREKRTLNTLLDLKVKERTRELEASQHQLLTAISQQKLMFTKAAAGMREKMNGLKGLCSVARAEISDPVAHRYVNSIDSASSQIESYFRSVMTEQMASMSEKYKALW